MVVNVSSPNTPGLRNLQRRRTCGSAHRRPRGAGRDQPRHVPLLVKIAPDLADEDIDAIAGLVVELGVDGIIATNTTISRDHLISDPAQVAALGTGGLSGPR